MKVLIVAFAFAAVGCGSSPTSPTPPPVTPPVVVAPPPPPVLSVIATVPCPTSTSGVEFGFYLQIGCNNFDKPLQPVRRWNVAPKIYLKTVDEAGAPIDAMTLDTVQNAMIAAAPTLTAGRLSVSVERGTASREGQSGWITVRWPGAFVAADFLVCGRAPVAVDGGYIELNHQSLSCGCGGSRVAALTARHELGHALGYWHTDNPTDLMFVNHDACDASPSARELQAIAYQYR